MPEPDNKLPNNQADIERKRKEEEEARNKVTPREGEPAPERTTLEKVIAGEDYTMAAISELHCDDITRPVPWSIINAMILHLEGLQSPIDAARRTPQPPQQDKRKEDERGVR